ncbi:MAG: hypothetical protein HDR71_13330 [Lachnospiraceae bacterium]|nr:hypothetical protein [Lachnospiraceae bacterium]
MLIITCLGILILFVIQFVLYKKNQNGSLKKIFKSEQLLDVLKELLVIILGATVALNFTNVEEKKQTKETVMRLLEVTYSDISMQYVANEILLDNYKQERMSAQQVKYNTQYNTALFENVLNNDTVITNISPLMYSMLVNDFRNLSLFYESLEEYSDNDEYVITMISNMNSHNENIMWALEKEIKHLKGEYKEQELKDLYQEYISSKYVEIPNLENIENK